MLLSNKRNKKILLKRRSARMSLNYIESNFRNRRPKKRNLNVSWNTNSDTFSYFKKTYYSNKIRKK